MQLIRGIFFHFRMNTDQVFKFFPSNRSRNIVEMALEHPMILDENIIERQRSCSPVGDEETGVRLVSALTISGNNTDIYNPTDTSKLSDANFENSSTEITKLPNREQEIPQLDYEIEAENETRIADKQIIFLTNEDLEIMLPTGDVDTDFQVSEVTITKDKPNVDNTIIVKQSDKNYENALKEITNHENGKQEISQTESENEAEIGENPDDPDYEVAEAESDNEQNENDLIINEGQKRKRKPEQAEWDREKAKFKRMKGEAYLGYTRDKDGKVFHNKMREPKTMGAACTSSKCVKYKNRFCNTISCKSRNEIFQNFWKELDWDQKKIYITSLMKKKSTVRTFVPGDSRRSFTYEYFLRVNSEFKQVCKKMFLSTLGLKEWMVSQWCSENTHGMHSPRVVLNAKRKLERPKPESVQIVERQKLFLKTFLENLPKMPSHYCRKDSKKLYLETDFGSKANIHRIYTKHCEDNSEEALSMYTFWEAFDDMNLALFVPKKDQCNICVSYSAGNVDAKEYNTHLELKDKARIEKNEDKAKAEAGKQHAFVMDVQAVKLCPVNNANKFYFKTRLKVHNFTIFNLATRQCTNYWWNESEADLTASVFTSIIISHLEKYCTDDIPIVLWSDGCPYQNRNAVLANALCNYSVKYQKVVTQKYLEPGHTQMECDSVHSVIERKLKNKDISLPYDYVNITKSARIKPFPYDVEYLEHTFFKNYDNPNLMRYKSIRPGRGAHDPTVTNLRLINYDIDGVIKYKLNFKDDLKDLPQRFKEVCIDIPLQPLYQRRLKISKLKYDHLQDIKTTLATEFHHFYDTIYFE